MGNSIDIFQHCILSIKITTMDILLICLGPDVALNKSKFIITYLAKEVMFFIALVCLSVCLSVDNITQKVMNRLG